MFVPVFADLRQSVIIFTMIKRLTPYIVVLFVLAGCNVPPEVFYTPTAGQLPSETPEETQLPTSSAPAPATEIPTATPIEITPVVTIPPTPTLVEVPIDIANAGFEGPHDDERGGQVGRGWHTWGITGTSHPSGTTKLYEWVITNISNRVHSGFQAQKFFGVHAPGDGGIYQDVTVPDGCTRLEFRVWAHGWSADEWARHEPTQDLRQQFAGYGRVGIDTDGSPIYDFVKWTSDRATADDRNSLTLQLGLGPAPANPLGAGITYSDSFGYIETENGYALYDNYTLISWVFEDVPSGLVRLVIRGTNYFAMAHNDYYVDDVSATCWVGTGEPQPTATVQVPPTAVPTDSANYDPQVELFSGFKLFDASENLRVYTDHNFNAFSPYGIGDGQRNIRAYGLWHGQYYAYWPGEPYPQYDIWLCLDSSARWVQHPEFPVLILNCSEWLPYAINGAYTGVLR